MAVELFTQSEFELLLGEAVPDAALFVIVTGVGASATRGWIIGRSNSALVSSQQLLAAPAGPAQHQYGLHMFVFIAMKVKSADARDNCKP